MCVLWVQTPCLAHSDSAGHPCCFSDVITTPPQSMSACLCLQGADCCGIMPSSSSFSSSSSSSPYTLPFHHHLLLSLTSLSDSLCWCFQAAWRLSAGHCVPFLCRSADEKQQEHHWNRNSGGHFGRKNNFIIIDKKKTKITM